MNLLIVKLGAMGDVLRTTPLLSAYKKLYPDARITWVVDAASRPVLLGNQLIDRVLDFGPETLALLKNENFDTAVNLDKEKEALDAIEAARSPVKKGFGWNAGRSALRALNPASEYAVRLGVDDDLKFRQNRKSYQEISFEQAEVPYAEEEYILTLSSEDRAAAQRRLTDLGFGSERGRSFIGINTGSGDRFAGKRLPAWTVAELSRRVAERWKRPALLLGGPKEHERNVMIEREARPHAVNSGTDHSIQVFAALVERCALVFTGDTIALHVAVAMKTPVVAYFGSTSAPEIELYGRGRKIVSEIACAPCYKRDCPIDDQCMRDMRVDRLLAESEALVLAGAPAR